jgi:hypothetical protein
MAQSPLSTRLSYAAGALRTGNESKVAAALPQLLDEAATAVALTEEVASAHIHGAPEQVKQEMAETITEHLCSVWGWQPDEEEAIRMGEQLAEAFFTAVRGTYTQPSSLLSALIAPRYSEFARQGDGMLIIRES